MNNRGIESEKQIRQTRHNRQKNMAARRQKVPKRDQTSTTDNCSVLPIPRPPYRADTGGREGRKPATKDKDMATQTPQLIAQVGTTRTTSSH